MAAQSEKELAAVFDLLKISLSKADPTLDKSNALKGLVVAAVGRAEAAGELKGGDPTTLQQMCALLCATWQVGYWLQVSHAATLAWWWGHMFLLPKSTVEVQCLVTRWVTSPPVNWPLILPGLVLLTQAAMSVCRCCQCGQIYKFSARPKSAADCWTLLLKSLGAQASSSPKQMWRRWKRLT